MRQRLKQSRVIFAGLALFAFVVGYGNTAEAQFNIATGLKWTPLRYTTPVRAATDGATIASSPLYPNFTSGNGWQTTSLDNYIAFFVLEQVGITLSLDIGYGSFHTDTTDQMNKTVQDNWTFLQVGFALGGKFYLNRPTAQRVSPYLSVDFYKYFASVNTSEIVPINDQIGAIAGLHAPLGFDLAFGAEYFFTPAFSVGAEVLGLRYSYVEGEFTDAGMTKHTEKDQLFTFYGGISLNYRFLATAKVSTYEEEEERKNPRGGVRRPAPRPRRIEEESAPPPSPPPPVPSPESVD